jgi:acetolactate synthase-1/2/3 large subunit
MTTATTQTARLAGHLLVECLIEQGVTHAFGVPGESFLAVLDGFHAHPDRITWVSNRQEGGAAFMAEAHGKLTGRPGVCFVTRGPGATNASIGVHTAYQDGTPMVLFVGDVASDARHREAFQELDFSAFFGPSTQGMAKRVERIDDPERVPEYVARAFATAMQGRPGPVVLVLPEDMLTQSVRSQPLPRVPERRQAPDPEAMAAMRRVLVDAQRPLVIAGGPAWSPQAAQALQVFAERWQLPVANAFRYQDCFDNHHPLYAGDVGLGINPALAERVRQADVLLAVGPRLGEATTSGYTLLQVPVPQQRLLHIHGSAEELGRVYQAEVGVCADMRSAAGALAAWDPPTTPVWRDWAQSAHQDYLANVAVDNGGVQWPSSLDMAQVIHTVQAHLPKDAVLTNGAGNFASWLHRFYRYTGWAQGAKTQLAPTNGAMGYGVPAGIAAAITTARVVLTIAGDGDFLMNGQELATAVQHGAKTIVLLVNNGSYGTIRMHQEREYPKRVSGSALHNPDFVALAQAYGYRAERITHTAEFEAALLRALAAPLGTVLELVLPTEVITTRTTLSAIQAAALKRV